MLIRDAEIDGQSPRDVRLEGDRVSEVGRRLTAASREEVLDAGGAALIPGLHDHHLHLFALAAVDVSVACGPPEVRDAASLAAALAAAELRDGWVRGIGYHESVAGALDRDRLDGFRSDPVRVQHRSGALWVVNSAGAERLGLDAGADAPGVERNAAGRATGRIFRLDGWLRERLGVGSPPPLAAVGRRLAAYGVTGVTDATPGNGKAELAAFTDAVTSGALPQRVVLMGSAELPEPEPGRIVRGPLKLVLAEDGLPTLDELVARIDAARAQQRGVAVHCVTRAELVLAVAAFAAAGARAGDRIEHAAVAPPDVIRELASLPLTVVTQPNFVKERGDAYLGEVEPQDRPWLYRCRGWLEAGVLLAGGTDAPFGDPDPWLAMRAAVERRSESGAVLGADEALAPERALALFTTHPQDPGGPSRRVEPGAPADLCLLDAPWLTVRRELDSRYVRATIRAGEIVFRRDSA